MSILAQAIAREENVAPSYNNPGGINDANGIITYPTQQAGQSALENLLTNALSGTSQNYSPNESIQDFENTYTGGDPNAGNNVASFLGVSPSTPINSFGDVVSAQQNSASAPSTYAQALAGIQNGILGPQGTNLYPQGSATTPNLFGSKLGGYTIPSVTDIVAILAGLVLLGGAVFGFKQLSTTVVTGVKKGAALSAL